jgi:hypothetical protein
MRRQVFKVRKPTERPTVLTGERTRLCVSVPIETYMRLALHCEHRDGALSQFVTRAIEAQIVREELDEAPPAEAAQ